MIKTTKIGTLKATGEPVVQCDAGALRIFKTLAGKVVNIPEIDFFDGPVKPVTEKTLVNKSAIETPKQETIPEPTMKIETPKW